MRNDAPPAISATIRLAFRQKKYEFSRQDMNNIGGIFFIMDKKMLALHCRK